MLSTRSLHQIFPQILGHPSRSRGIKKVLQMATLKGDIRKATAASGLKKVVLRWTPNTPTELEMVTGQATEIVLISVDTAVKGVQ